MPKRKQILRYAQDDKPIEMCGPKLYLRTVCVPGAGLMAKAEAGTLFS
jgi:hypothetical protein